MRSGLRTCTDATTRYVTGLAGARRSFEHRVDMTGLTRRALMSSSEFEPGGQMIEPGGGNACTLWRRFGVADERPGHQDHEQYPYPVHAAIDQMSPARHGGHLLQPNPHERDRRVTTLALAPILTEVNIVMGMTTHAIRSGLLFGGR